MDVSGGLCRFHTKRPRFGNVDFSAVTKCGTRNTVIRCRTAPRASVPLGPRNVLLLSDKTRCLSKAASVAHAVILKTLAGRRGASCALILGKFVRLSVTRFPRKAYKARLSTLTHLPV